MGTFCRIHSAAAVVGAGVPRKGNCSERYRPQRGALSPIPLTNLRFTKELGRRLHRPAVFRMLRRVGGDFASELLLGGQRVLPNKALSNGFAFRQTLRSAFEAIL